ncbi:hypothetical protein [uncultured Desulfobacter sp.]|uniref:hypothetical protein n=1 Tax=uncultured Desulfobacter sp. TaxID=240139 RepID=UPI0029F560C3|nr:hypothetical protein [uncultured Desulfobacter sp.]
MSVQNYRRRLFFKQMAGSATDLFQSWVGSFEDESVVQTGITSEISGDLAPELLVMEAQRLGLDPEKDKEKIKASILAALGRPGVKDNQKYKRK